MEKITAFFLRNHKLTIMLTFFVVIGGIMGMSSLNSESFPAVNMATAIVETDYPGAAPNDIETKITKPIEDKIRTVTGLKDVRSVSQSGKSKIIIRVEMDDYDVDEVMTDIEKAINEVNELPNDLLDEPKFTEVKSEEFPAIEIAVVGDNTDRRRDLIADLLKEDLEDNRKIKDVIFSGFRKREFLIELDREKMIRHHIGINEVLSQISQRNVDVPGGDLIEGDSKKLVRIQAKIATAEELENLLVRSNFSGRKIFLKDIAVVKDTEEKPRFLSRYNGKEATLLIVNKKAGADTLELVEEVQKTISRYQSTYKDDVQIAIYNNEAEKVKNRLEILSSNALGGLVLVIVFLLIFLPGKIGIMASFSLPLAVMATFGIMPAFGMNLDAITILALVIALGMLVDNSVVLAENFARLKKEGKESHEAAILSVRQLALPITATAMTTIGAFLPMLVTRGVMGEFIKYIPIVVTIALIISLIESFFLLPLRLTLIGDSVKKTPENKKSDWFEPLVLRFEALMSRLIKRRYWVATLFGGIIFGSVFMMGVANQFILFPAEQTEVYLARFTTPTGTTLEKTSLLGEKLTYKVKEALGSDIKNVVAKIGSSLENPNDPIGKDGDNTGILIIHVTDQAKFDLDYRDALKKLRKIKMEEFSELSFQERINGPPVGTAIAATFRSNNAKNLDEALALVIADLNQIEGIFDLKIDDVIGDNEIYLDVDYNKADQLGLSAERIGNAVRTALSGSVVSDVTLENKDVDLRVKMLGRDRKNMDDLKSLRIMDQRGNLIPLSTVARFRETKGSPQVKRFDFKRAKTINANVNEELLTSAEGNAALRKSFNAIAEQYPDISLVFGGQEESTKESMESLGKAMILALIAIFCLMVFVFSSYLKPLIIMSTIPLGLVGFSIAFFLHSRPISFLAMIGVVGLAGIIVNSGIVLISFIESMKKEGKLPLEAVLAKASSMRLRAVVVTSLTTVSGLFPTAYGIGGSDAILVPMTLAMAWGLTSGTILTLLWIPSAYAILEDFNELTRNVRRKILGNKRQEEI